MMKPWLCVGKIADRPYYFSKTLINVYSIEELCYCIRQDAYLIDEELVSRKLSEWIEHQCGLSDLARSLEAVIAAKGTASAFAGIILRYVSFFSEEEIVEIEELIRQNANLDEYERAKAKADYLLGNRKFNQAVIAYGELLEKVPKQNAQLKSAVLYNLGNAYANLFQFHNAANCYRLSYQVIPNEESLMQYLCAIRIQLSEKEYLDFIAEHGELFGPSQKVEQLMLRCEEQFQMTEAYRMLFTMKVCREEGHSTAGLDTSYYDEIERMSVALKDAYREMVAQ